MLRVSLLKTALFAALGGPKGDGVTPVASLLRRL